VYISDDNCNWYQGSDRLLNCLEWKQSIQGHNMCYWNKTVHSI